LKIETTMLRMNLKKEVAKKSHFLLDILHGKFRLETEK